MRDRCGFLFVRCKRHCCTELVSWEHAACPLSGIKKRPLVGGWLNTSSMVISIGATASVRYREVVRSWEGPLWEVPLYIKLCYDMWKIICVKHHPTHLLLHRLILVGLRWTPQIWHHNFHNSGGKLIAPVCRPTFLGYHQVLCGLMHFSAYFHFCCELWLLCKSPTAYHQNGGP